MRRADTNRPITRSRHRARPHLRHGHRKNQRHRADPSRVQRMVHRLRHRLHADYDDAVRHRISLPERRRHLGRHHPHRLGLRHRQLRLVDRHRPRRHADLRHPLIAAPIVAQLHQPLRRSHDAVRRGLRRNFPRHPRGPSRGSPTGCSLIPTPWACGRSSAAR